MFAGSCIGVICLVITLEALKWAQRRTDEWFYQQQVGKANAAGGAAGGGAVVSEVESRNGGGKLGGGSTGSGSDVGAAAAATNGPRTFFTLNTLSPTHGYTIRPAFWQQVIRSFIHMLQFAVAYFVMLLAMYYNGYFIICIFIGAYLGHFIFSWDAFKCRG